MVSRKPVSACHYSVFYKPFAGVLHVRSVTAEYLIATKLRSGRKYKNDLSDILGILAEHERQGKPITRDMVETAVTNFYGDWVHIPGEAKTFIENAFRVGHYQKAYAQVRKQESQAGNH